METRVDWPFLFFTFDATTGMIVCETIVNEMSAWIPENRNLLPILA